MRTPILLIIAMVVLTDASAALAAPTCLNREGITIRCGAPGAMPVGWTLSPEQLWDRQLSIQPGPGTAELLKVFGGLALFLAMIALLPDFEGSPAGGWDKQEGDDKE